MSIRNYFQIQGEIARMENVACEDFTAYKFVIAIADDAQRGKCERIDVFAYPDNDNDPWADLRIGLCVTISGSLRQDEGGSARLVGETVGLLPQDKEVLEDFGGFKVVAARERENRAMRDVLGED